MKKQINGGVVSMKKGVSFEMIAVARMNDDWEMMATFWNEYDEYGNLVRGDGKEFWEAPVCKLLSH